jgi:hypothetical protein
VVASKAQNPTHKSGFESKGLLILLTQPTHPQLVRHCAFPRRERAQEIHLRTRGHADSTPATDDQRQSHLLLVVRNPCCETKEAKAILLVRTDKRDTILWQCFKDAEDDSEAGVDELSNECRPLLVLAIDFGYCNYQDENGL